MLWCQGLEGPSSVINVHFFFRIKRVTAYTSDSCVHGAWLHCDRLVDRIDPTTEWTVFYCDRVERAVGSRETEEKGSGTRLDPLDVMRERVWRPTTLVYIYYNVHGEYRLSRRRVSVSQYVTEIGDVVSHFNITKVQVEDGGVYECTVSNRAGQVSHSAKLQVYGTYSNGVKLWYYANRVILYGRYGVTYCYCYRRRTRRIITRRLRRPLRRLVRLG